MPAPVVMPQGLISAWMSGAQRRPRPRSGEADHGGGAREKALCDELASRTRPWVFLQRGAVRAIPAPLAILLIIETSSIRLLLS